METMWDIFDQWIVYSLMAWAAFTFWQKLFNSYKLACRNPCEKKIFNNKSELSVLGSKIKNR